MSKPCITCGIAFNGDESKLARIFKEQYDKHGIERYVYRLSENGNFHFVRKESFNVIFETQIKPNFDNGSDFFHIKELK